MIDLRVSGQTLQVVYGVAKTFLFLSFLSIPNSDANTIANLETLQLVQVFFRHGDRSPITNFPKNTVNITKEWPTGLGQLTPKGKAQSCELGEFIRKRYTTFILPEFQPGEVIAKSSTIPRAIQTGLGVLGGLYDVKGKGCSINDNIYYIQTIPEDHDNLIAFSALCPLYEKEHFLFCTRGEGHEVLEKHKAFLRHISENTGIPESNMNFDKMAGIYDTLLIQRLYGHPHPEWAQRSYNDKDTLVLKGMAQLAFVSLTHNPTTMRLRGGPLLSEITKNFETFITSRTASSAVGNKTPVPQKMYLYSGHDTTISVLLQALGVYKTHLVPYAAAVFVELHKKGVPLSVSSTSDQQCDSNANPNLIVGAGGSPEDYYIKVFYRNCTQGPPTELLIPHCSDKVGGVGCPLATFYTLHHTLLTVDFNKECHRGCSGGVFTSLYQLIMGY